MSRSRVEGFVIVDFVCFVVFVRFGRGRRFRGAEECVSRFGDVVGSANR